MVISILRPERFITVRNVGRAYEVVEGGSVHASFQYNGDFPSWSTAKVRAEAFRAGVLYERMILTDKYGTGGRT